MTELCKRCRRNEARYTSGMCGVCDAVANAGGVRKSEPRRLKRVGCWWFAMLAMVAACASQPPTRTAETRRLKRLARVTYCGTLSIRHHVQGSGDVAADVRVCGEDRDSCELMLLRMAGPIGEVEDPVFAIESCRAADHRPVDAPERRLLKRDRR